jgi:hypothetical protein
MEMVRNLIALILGVAAGLTAESLLNYIGNYSWNFWGFYFTFLGLFPFVICLVARRYTVLLAVVPLVISFISSLIVYPNQIRYFSDIFALIFYFCLSLPLPLGIGFLSGQAKGNFKRFAH